MDSAMRLSGANLRPFRLEIRHVVNGEVRWHDCISRPVRLPDGRTVWDGIIMDTTERNRAELALRESEERFRTVVEQAADALFLVVTISLYVGVLRQHLARAELDRLEADLKHVERAAREMQRLLDDLVSRLGKLAGPIR